MKKSDRLLLGDAAVGTIKYLMISGKTFVRTKNGWVELDCSMPCSEENKVDEEEGWTRIAEQRRERMRKRFRRRGRNGRNL